MAVLAKILGFFCMVGAVFEVVLGIAYLASSRPETSHEAVLRSSGPGVSAAASVLVVNALLLAFLLLVTVGAAAFVVGQIADRQAAEYKRRGAASPPGERPYGAKAYS